MIILKVLILVASLMNFAHAGNFIPEASGICRVGDKFIVAGDEEKDSVWVSDESGDSQKVEVKGGSWDDLEALAPVDAKSFLGMTSHGLTKKGTRKPAREALMLFSVTGHSIKVEKTWSLRDQILAYLAKDLSQMVDMKIVSASAPQDGGLNIEGLAYSNGKIYFGLRSPLTKNGKAILLEGSFSSGVPLITSFRLFEFAGNGVRDLQAVPEGMLILAGSKDDKAENFATYQMTSAGALSRIMIPGFEDLMRPEGFLRDKDGSFVLVQDFIEEEHQEFFVRLPHL